MFKTSAGWQECSHFHLYFLTLDRRFLCVLSAVSHCHTAMTIFQLFKKKNRKREGNCFKFTWINVTAPRLPLTTEVRARTSGGATLSSKSCLCHLSHHTQKRAVARTASGTHQEQQKLEPGALGVCFTIQYLQWI